MQIVIKLSDKIYDTIVNDLMPTNDEMKVIVQRIYEGTPLPEGHGRLIDESKVVSINESDGKVWCEAPTIIEADKVESEDLANLDSMLEDLWNATVEDHRKYSEVEE